ncbi:MAG: glycosyltransferase family 39 protein [Saprospiraceae bacterium]
MKIDKIALFFCLISISILTFWYYPKWNKSGSEATLSWDSSGYYWYLPAVFIYHDLKQLTFSQDILQKYQPTPEFQQAYVHPSGNYVLKYSSGQAIMMFPGFISGHLAAKVLKYPQDGFSPPYQFGIFIWGWIMCLFGIYMLYKVLRIHFSAMSTAITLLVIVFGTNYLEYGGITNTMTHNYLFTYYACLIYVTDRFYNNPSILWSICIGAILGIMVLTRPTEILAVIIPLLYGLNFSLNDVVQRIKFIGVNIAKYLLAIALFIGIGSIQLFYWKYVSGEWLVYSYEDQGFSWLHPHMFEGFFSATGWMVYSPLVILFIPGIFALWYQKRNLAPTFTLFIILFIYVTFAWDIWWYGGSVGQRALVQMYPVLAFPIAAFVGIFKKVSVFAILGTLLMTLGIHYNFWVIHQAHKGGMLFAGFMTRPYLMAILLRDKMPDGALNLMDTRYNYQGILQNPKILLAQDSMRKECISGDIQYSQVQKVTLEQNGGWLRISANFVIKEKEWDTWKMTQLIVRYKHGEDHLGDDVLRVQRHFDGGSKNLYLDSKIRVGADTAEIFLWNADGRKELCMENLEIVYHTGD